VSLICAKPSRQISKKTATSRARASRWDGRTAYDWAETGGNVTEADCEAILLRWPNRNSFYEGCLAYVEEPSRGSDQDDDGDDID
jgi:hypothetical protein